MRSSSQSRPCQSDPSPAFGPRIGALVLGSLLMAVVWHAARPVVLHAAEDNRPGQVQHTEQLIAAARQLGDQSWQDPHRPRYHFLPPAAWLNDPNGALYWKGRFHLFYQHNPEGGYWKWMQWGHASSADLVHWTHHPIALTPTPNGPDRDGCFSGGVVIHDGVPTFVYHGVPEGTCLASSRDDELVTWTKHPDNPVISSKKIAGDFFVYDPCAWRKGDTWYALCGRVDKQGGDTAYLFRSPDLVKWSFVGPFYKSDRRWTDADEDCAVPDFFPLGDKHVLTFASHKRGGQYYLGRYEGDRFCPEHHGRMNWPGGQLIAPISLEDPQKRRILFAWLKENRPEEACRAAGWAGTLTLPRVLSLDSGGQLRIEPIPELNGLRYDERSIADSPLTPGNERSLDEVRGDCLELSADIDPGDATEVGLLVRRSPDGAEQTAIVCDLRQKSLKIDLTKSTADPTIKYPALPFGTQFVAADMPEGGRFVQEQAAPFELKRGESLQLRVFLDKSVLEVFANGRQAIAQRIYPTRPDALGTAVFVRGGTARLKSLNAWSLHGS